MSDARAMSMPAPVLSTLRPGLLLGWPLRRESITTLVVVAGHALALLALHQGLKHSLEQPVEPARIISTIELVSAAPTPVPQPQAQPTPQPPEPQPRKVLKPEAAPKPRTAAPTPVPKPVLSTTSESATTALAAPPVAAPQPESQEAPTTVAASTTTANAAAPERPAAPAIELPSSRAAYLNNPKPPYPAAAKRRGEEGRVVIKALIGIDGLPSQARVHKSSGFDLLDQTALETVQRWRFVPGKRAGVAEAMWYDIPLSFELD